MPHQGLLELLDEREYERNCLIGDLKTKIIHKEDELGGKKLMAAAILYGGLHNLLPGGREPLPNFILEAVTDDPNGAELINQYVKMVMFLKDTIKKRIQAFTQVEAERFVIVSVLTTWALQTITQDFHADFLRVTQSEREQFLRDVGKLP
ncbi:MAG: hypothetical protein M3Q73_01975 [bacterium]|nr:hypothetical protein [bacterium]